MRINVFTCGVFDLFHYGHLDFLLRARELGDRLIVGVNADDYVVRKKGHPPIFPLRERMMIVNALECVAEVRPFWEDDPCALLRRLVGKPQRYFAAGDKGVRWIVAKGSEYTHANAPEAALIESLGGTFVTLDSLPIHSSELLARLVRVPMKPLRCRCGFPETINNLFNCGHEQNCPCFTD